VGGLRSRVPVEIDVSSADGCVTSVSVIVNPKLIAESKGKLGEGLVLFDAWGGPASERREVREAGVVW